MSFVAVATKPGPTFGLELERGLTVMDLGLPQEARAKLCEFLEILFKWNRIYNLTAVREPQKMVSHHLLDSLAVLPHLTSKRLLDVGSGAGFPGIPLAIARPDLDTTLLDSSQKKTAFLRQAVAQLGLRNVAVVRERVEAWDPSRSFDLVIARAFADLADFVHATQHLLAPRGVFAAMKGRYAGEEIERLPKGFRLQRAVKLAVPGVKGARHLIFVERS